jgi:hypothetical protein
MHDYDVEYQLEGETKWKRIEATDPGQAFVKAQMMFPGARMLKALRHGNGYGEAWTEYEAPPVQRGPEVRQRAFNPKTVDENTMTFPFYDQVKKSRHMR